jgi:hypothetical protein
MLPTYLAGSPAARHKAIKLNEYSEHEPVPLRRTSGATFHPPSNLYIQECHNQVFFLQSIRIFFTNLLDIS